MKIALLLFFVFVAVAPQPDSRGGRRFQSEPTYSPETPFRDNVPAPVFGAGHNKSPINQRYWPEETSRYQSPWESSRPFGNFERGNGRDSAEEDGRGSEASGGRDQRPAKVVGVNMQMVAGMYPDGHYSPLSGPYEEERRPPVDHRHSEDRSPHPEDRPPHSEDRPPRPEDRPAPRREHGPRHPPPQGPYRERESGSPHPNEFYGPKPISREREEYDRDDLRRRKFEEKDRHPEEYDRRDRKYKPDEEPEEGFRRPDKGGHLHMGRARPDDDREVADRQEGPERMERFPNFHRDEDSREEPRGRKMEDSRRDGDPRKGRIPEDRIDRSPDDRKDGFPAPEKVKPREEEEPADRLVDGEAGVTEKASVDKRTTLPEEPLSETTTVFSDRSTSSQ